MYVHEDLIKYMIEIVHATRKHPKVMQGVSPRGTLAFVRAAQGFAMTEGREYVVPEDVKSVAAPVLAAEKARYEEEVVREIADLVKVPVEEWGIG